MTMMDTRVGAPGADIPDDDLDFAVAVKLRLDRGEDVPDEDLDRAVAIKLRLAPAAAPAPAPTAMGPGGMQPYPRVQLPAPTPEQAAANQAQLLKDLEARYGAAPPPAAEGPNPSNVSLGEGGYTPPAPPQRGILAEAANAFQAGAQGLEAGIGQAGAALGDVLARTGSPALGGQLQQGRSGGIVEPAGAPSVLPEGTNPFYALAYKGTRMVAGMVPSLAAGAAIGPAVGGVAGLLAGAAPMSVEAGGHTYQAAVDAGIDETRAMNAGLAAAAVAEVAGSTQLGIILRKFPWLQQGVQNLVERRVAAYLAERGAEATFNGLVGVAQQAANDSIHVASGINPNAFDAFWTEQAPEAFAGGALPTAVMGLGHDALRLPGAIADNRQAARSAADVQQAQDFARQTAEGQNLPYPAVQQRVEGPPAPVQGTSLRTPPPPAEAGPAAATSSAAGTPDQPPARDPGAPAGGEDPYAAIDALRARMAGAPPAPPAAAPPPSPAPAIEVGDLVQWTSQGVAQLPEPRKVESFATWTDGRTYAKLEGSNTMVPLDELQPQQPPAEPPTSSITTPSPPPPPPPGRQYPQRAPQRPAAPGPRPRPDLGSSRLNIPLSPEMEAERAQQTVQQNVSAWQREKANRDRPVPLPKVEPATEPPQTSATLQAPESVGAAEGDRTSPPPPQPGESQQTLDGAPGETVTDAKGQRFTVGPTLESGKVVVRREDGKAVRLTAGEMEARGWGRNPPESPESSPRPEKSQPATPEVVPPDASRVGPPPAEVANPPGLPKGEKKPWEMSLEEFIAWNNEQNAAFWEADKKASVAERTFGAEDPRAKSLRAKADRLKPESGIATINRKVVVTRALQAGYEVPDHVLAETGLKRPQASQIDSPESGRVGPPPETVAKRPRVPEKFSDYEKIVNAEQPEDMGDTEDTTPPAPHPAASDQRERVHQEVRAAFGEQGAEALPLLDAYARSWTAATGKPAGEFYGRFSFEKGGGDGEGMKQAGESWYYSAAQKAVEAFKDPKARMTGEQWEKWLRAQPGIKPEEMDYLGLSAAPGKMTPQEAAAWIDTNRIKVEETVLGDFTASWEQAKAAAKKAGASEEEFRGAYGKYRNWNHDNEPFPWEDYHPSLREIVQPLAEKRQGGSESKFENWQLPGGTGYRELLLRLPEQDDYGTAWKKWAIANGMENAPLAESERAFQQATGRTADDRETFRGGHFEQPNVLAHVRFNDRTDADGKRVLFIEEIQSDWHQKGRKHGYAIARQGRLPPGWKLDRISAEEARDMDVPPNDWTVRDVNGDIVTTIPGHLDEPAARREAITAATDAGVNLDELGGQSSTAIPDAPFKTTWPALAFKRMMAWAVENGYDRIAWTTGDMQADRYDLSKQVDSIRVDRRDDGSYEITATKNGSEVLNKKAADPAALEELIGKDLAKKAVEDLTPGKNGPDPEAVAAYAKLADAAKAYLDADTKELGSPIFVIEKSNRGEPEWKVRNVKKNFVVDSFNNEAEALVATASYTHGARGWDRGDGKTPIGDKAYRQFMKVYEKEWRDRENAGEFAPESKQALALRNGKTKTYTGLDLKVGGEGMKGFYDQILPAEVNKLVKKMGGRVGQTEIATPPTHTPKTRRVQQDPEGGFNVEVLNNGRWEYDGRHFETANDANAYVASLEPQKSKNSVHALDITPGIREAVGKGLPLFQGAGGGNKGSYRLLEDGRAIIRALDNPDASTLPHELGHAFLDFLHEIDPKLHADAMKALGAAGETPTVENHERWSRAFEAYLREGKAPTSLLRATFEKFKSWLRDIYRTISRGPLAKKLTPALRQVFDQMLSRGDQPSEPAPAPKVREVGKRRTAPVERREWSKADLADRIQRKYENSPNYDADLSQEHVEGDLSGFTRFSGKIPGELLTELEGRPDLLKMLHANAPAGTAGGADALAQLGAEGYVRRLTRWQQGQTKDTIAKLRRNSADPEAAFLADLWESTPKGGGKPKETVKAEDLAERGLRFTIDDRPASIIQRSGDLYLRVKDLGTYPLVAFDEVPVDKGSLAKGAGGKEMFQAAQDDQRDRSPTPPTSKLVDVAAYLATNQARLKRRGGGRVDNKSAVAALDRFLGHGKYGSELPEKVRGMANRMLARSLNKYGFTDPAALEARVGKAFRAAEIADRRAARPSRLQKALDQANGVRPEPTTQDAVDRAVAIERAHAEVGTAMQVRKAELAGEKKVAKLKDLLSEKGLQAAREMAEARRQARDRIIDQASRFRKKLLTAKLQGEVTGSNEGWRAGREDLQAIKTEAYGIVAKGLPRGERGRSVILKALRNARRATDVFRLIEEVQHRAVSARAAESWKAIRKATKGKGISSLPEAAKDIVGFTDGTPIRANVRKLVDEAKLAYQVAKNQKAEPVRLAKLLNQRSTERAIIKDPAATPLQKALARDVLRTVNAKLRDLRPDLQPKVDAAKRLADISNEIRTTKTAVKNADAVFLSDGRRAARGMRRFMETRIQAAPKISTITETKPGVEEKVSQTLARQGIFLNWTPDTLGQWVDNAIGHPEQAQFGHHLLFKEPLRAAGAVAQEKVARLAALEELAKKHGFNSWDHATAVISGTHGGGLQQTVDIDVPGWIDKRITLGEALKIFGDDQDPQTSDLSDEGMAHRLDRRYKHAAALDRPARAAIIAKIPQRFRDFYTEFKELKEKMLGGRALELRRRYRGTAPETIPMREPRLRQGDSDYITDYFESGSQSRSLMEQSFMRDRVHNPGPVNLIVDGLESHMRDWDSQLHLIHHADLADAMSKTLLHKDILSAIGERGGKQAVERIESYINRILGTEVKSKPTAVDKVAKLLRKNVGLAMTALSPRSFVKQFSVIPMLGAMYPKEMLKASGKIGQNGLRERVMASHGLLAQRFHMADAAKAASAGLSNPIFDSGDFKLRGRAGLANLKDAGKQLGDLGTRDALRALGSFATLNGKTGVQQLKSAARQLGKTQLRNATMNVLRALGNFRDATTNGLRFNSWADEQGVKAAFLICEQLVDRDHPNLNAADRERLIGQTTAELVHRTMNTYDTPGQSFWRSDLDQSSAMGLLNMFSNDSTKQANLVYQAAASGDKALAARIAGGLAMSAAWSVMAPAAMTLIGAELWRHYTGGSESDKERQRNLRNSLAYTAGRELAGKLPVIGADLIADLVREAATGKGGDVGVANSPVTQTLSTLLRQPALALYNTWSAEDDEDKTEVANYEAKRRKAALAAAAMEGSLRSGATVAGVGAMPVIALLRSMKPEMEAYGLAANWARRGDEDKAAEILADEAEKMRKAGLEDQDIKEHLVTVVRSRLNRDVEKDDQAGRLESDRTARRVVSAALSR